MSGKWENMIGWNKWCGYIKMGSGQGQDDMKFSCTFLSSLRITSYTRGFEFYFIDM